MAGAGIHSPNGPDKLAGNPVFPQSQHLQQQIVGPFLYTGSLVLNLLLICVFPGWKGRDGASKLVSDYMAKKINLDALITHTLNLDKINEAVELMKTGKWQVTYTIFMSKYLGPREMVCGGGGGNGREVMAGEATYNQLKEVSGICKKSPSLIHFVLLPLYNT